MATSESLGDLRARGRELILAAFAKARESGKPDWRAMTTAVLKNRLLDVTDGAFDEADWGATSTQQFVRGFPELLQIDTSTRPATIRLLEAAEPAPTGEPILLVPLGPRRQIRPDLWRAVLDFSSGSTYIWDGQNAIELPDPPASSLDTRHVLPTLSSEEFQQWRNEFVASRSDDPPPIRASLETWREQGRGTRSLPPQLRHAWNAEIKRRVLERLIAWFDEEGLELPSDLVESTDDEHERTPDLRALRAYVHRCVDLMTRGELEGLQLPAGVAARVNR